MGISLVLLYSKLFLSLGLILLMWKMGVVLPEKWDGGGRDGMRKSPLGSCCPPPPTGSQVCCGSGGGPGHRCGFFQVREVSLHAAPSCVASVHDWVSREEGNEGSWKTFQRKQAPKWGKSLSKGGLVGVGAGVESRKDEWRQWGSGGRRHDSGVPSPVLPASLCDWVCPCPSLNPWTLPLSFLSQSIHLLEEDDSLYCISAWNDQVG